MRGTAGGLLTTVLMLTLLQALVSSDKATGRLGSLLSGAGTLIEHLASPEFPAIPDLRPPGANVAPVVAAVPALAKSPPRLPDLNPVRVA